MCLNKNCKCLISNYYKDISYPLEGVGGGSETQLQVVKI